MVHMEDSRLLWVVLAYMWPGATQQHICDQEQVSNTYMVGGKSATSGGLTGLRVLLGCSWGVLGRSWGFLGRSLRVSRDLGEILGGHKVLFGSSWSGLGAHLGRSLVVLGDFGGVLRRPWDLLGRSLVVVSGVGRSNQTCLKKCFWQERGHDFDGF